MEEITYKVKGVISFFKQVIVSRMEKKLNCFNYDIALSHLENFAVMKEIPFASVSKDWFDELKNYLKTAKSLRGEKPLAVNSANTYFSVITAVVRQAADERYIDHGITKDITNIQPRVKAVSTVLSIGELQQLANTECKPNDLKKAFLFSCLTGIQWKDLSLLTWKQISVDENDTWEVWIERDNESQRIPLSKQARELLGVGAHAAKPIFNLHYSAALCVSLNRWALRAGITKKITFQSARQTFGKLLLDQGTELELISELLGHAEIKTTLKFLNAKGNSLPMTSNYLRGFIA